MKMKIGAVAVVLTIVSLGRSEASAKSSLWVYTSIYKEFIRPIEIAFEEENPTVDVQVYQAGSEKLQAKFEAELLAKRPMADVIMSSDPFWTYGLSQRDLIIPLKSGKKYETNYYSMMVMIVHKSVETSKRPKGFSDLTKGEFSGQIQMGSPLESGTTFSTVAYLSRKYGWDYFKALSKNRIGSSGGNSAVIQKVESGEKKIGIVLLENALASIKRGSPIEVIYPEDGSIPIPSMQVVTKTSGQRDVAEKFASFVMTPKVQEMLRKGYMYSVRKEVPPPEGARALTEITKNTTPWTDQNIEEVWKEGQKIKQNFSEIVLE